ncbi:MAG: adenylate/guanylate cyclase domain-containing protein [Pirellulales bacterium]|nr:adenylate/guanylate cyclase domain-containing protein [Pirellulales bacterium]
MLTIVQAAVRVVRDTLAVAFSAPRSVDRYDHRTYYSMLMASLMALILHLSWIFIFYGLQCTPLSLINVASVLIWSLNIVILCRWGAVLTAVVIGSTEVVGHQFLAIYYLGWEYGFQYFLLVIVAFAFMMNFKSMLVPIAMFFVCLLSFLGFYYGAQYWLEPHVTFGNSGNVKEVFLIANVTSVFTILAIMSYVYSEAARTAEAKLDLERQNSEKLLLNILPVSIAQRLKEEYTIIADHFESATVLFSDIVGFTALSEKVTPTELVGRLNRIFSSFDDLVERHGLEKIKTIGDAYMVAGGFPELKDGHAQDVSKMALDMLDVISSCNRETDDPVSIRIGIHTGPAVAGVIGFKKFAYDVWGDTVNTASRMESSGLPGRIQISEQVAKLLGDDFVIEERGTIDVKGKGRMKTYWLVGHGPTPHELPPGINANGYQQ